MFNKSIISRPLIFTFSVIFCFLNSIAGYGIDTSENCPNDLLVLLRLDETSGPDYADLYGINNATATNFPTAVAGIINGGQLFNEQNYVNIPDIGNDFEWEAGCSFSLEFWIKSATHEVPQVGISRQIAGSGSIWYLALNEYGGALMELQDSKGNNFAVYNKDFSKSYTDDNWHHIVGIKDGTTDYMAIYADGELIEEKTAAFTGDFIASSPTDISIGYMLRADGSSWEYHVNGALDEVAVYTRALTSDEIVSSFNNGLPTGHCASISKTVIPSKPVTKVIVDNDRVYFNFADTGKILIEVYDVAGSLLNRTRSDNNELIAINIADFPKGIYLYKTFQNNKISSGKIVKN